MLFDSSCAWTSLSGSRVLKKPPARKESPKRSLKLLRLKVLVSPIGRPGNGAEYHELIQKVPGGRFSAVVLVSVMVVVERTTWTSMALVCLRSTG